jgi:nicotinate-nucleotide--dimethylbenzimidazole phosphoribosyltransferase
VIKLIGVWLSCALHLAGVSDEGLVVKQSVVQEALTVNRDLIQQGPLQALQAVGGLEVAAMTGAYLEAAKRGMPAVVDGYISGGYADIATQSASTCQPATQAQCFNKAYTCVHAHDSAATLNQ